MTEKEPSWLHKVIGTLFNPGGDPPAIHRAEAVCRQLSSDLTNSLHALKPVADGLHGTWQGNAGDAFQKGLDGFCHAGAEYAKHMTDCADEMEKLGNFIDEAQRQAKILLLQIAATIAAGAALTFFTAGLSNAAAVAVAAGDMGRLATLAARMAWVLSSQAMRLKVLHSALATVASRLAMGLAFSWASSAFVKGVLQDLNIFDPANWNATDANKIVLDGNFVMGINALASTKLIGARLNGPTGIPSIPRLLTGSALFGGASSSLFSVITQFGFHGKPFDDRDAWNEVAASLGVGLGSGVISAAGFRFIPQALGWTRNAKVASPPKLVTAGAPSKIEIDIDRWDVSRAVTGTVSDGINYVINYPKLVPAPKMPGAMGVPVAPHPPSAAPHLSAAEPAQRGGGTRTVHRGESLSSIAGEVYGNPRLWPRIAAANPQISDPAQIQPGEVLHLPTLVGVG